jgi:hypothetical protein
MRTLTGILGGALLLIASLLLPSVATAEEQFVNCGFWNSFKEPSGMTEQDKVYTKTLYLAGFFNGLVIGVAANLPEDKRKPAVDKIWPVGLSIERVRALVDQ